MSLHSSRALAACLVAALSSGTAFAQLSSYNEDFESLDQMDVAALGNAGWLVFGNVFDGGGGYLYGYGPFPAPNDGAAFCAIADMQGGPDQGDQQLSVYSDYNNQDHGVGNLIEANVFQEQIVDAGDVGKTFTFTFDAKLGNLAAPTTAQGFIKIIDGTVFSLDGFSFVDTTAIPTTWGTYSTSITITSDHVGDFLQFGFSSTATNFDPSANFYDNIRFAEDSGDLGSNYCTGAPNSVSPDGSTISATGSASIADGDLTLTADNATTQPAIFFFGPNQIDLPFGNGRRCVGGSIVRMDVIFGSGGTFEYSVTPTFFGAFTATSTNFQCWYRDPAGGGAFFNLSDGLEIVFTP